jgi:hypothetical protein
MAVGGGEENRGGSGHQSARADGARLEPNPGSLVNYDYLLKPVRIDELLDAVARRLAE